MTGIELYSTTAADNDSAPPNGWPEGMAPSAVNDCARQMMASIRTWYEDAQWINFGYTPTYVSVSSFTVSGNRTAIFTTGRRIKLTDSSTLYGTISSSSYSAPNTTVNVTLDSGSLSASLTAASVGILTSTNSALPSSSNIDTTFRVVNSVDATKYVKYDISGASTTRVGTFVCWMTADRNWTLPDATTTLVGTDVAQTLTNKTLTTPIINGNVTGTGLPNVCEGRLTLTSGVPVTTTDVTGATNIYFTPYVGNKVSLYTGSTWQQFTFTELTLALGTLTSGLPYDVFLDYNGGTPQLVSLAWTNDTTRATALTYQNGVLVKTGDTEQRYLGTFYTTATTTTEDSKANRYLWNYYNRVDRLMEVKEGTDSWSYSTSTYRQTNASTANQLNYVQGVSEDSVEAIAIGIVFNSTATLRSASVAIGLDNTTTPSGIQGQSVFSSAVNAGCTASYRGNTSAGRHYLAWLERGAGADTQTWYGDNGGTILQSGIHGSIRG